MWEIEKEKLKKILSTTDVTLNQLNFQLNWVYFLFIGSSRWGKKEVFYI